MREYEAREVEQLFIISYTCDKCGLVAKPDGNTVMEYQEFMSWTNEGGYNSVFGDGDLIMLELCQHCIKELLGEYIRVIKAYVIDDD
jgi:hypothetical protein